MRKINRCFLIVLAIAVGLTMAQSVFASMPATTIRGTIQAVNYGLQTITVNGHVYKLTPHVRFEGIGGIGALLPGMQVDITVLGTSRKPTAHVAQITVHPKGS